MFGYASQAQPSQAYLAPQRHLSSQHRAIRTPARHRKNRHEFARNSTEHHHSIAWRHRHQPQPSQFVQGQPVAPPASVTRLCCSDAQDAINHIVKDDPTLRPGDAYMSTDGLRVYQGERKNDLQFVPVDKARHIGAGLKQRLAEVESKARVSAPEHSADVDAKASKRAMVEPQHATNEKKHKEKFVHGPDGRLIRMVGGFVN
jgi:hypothetical protein